MNEQQQYPQPSVPKRDTPPYIPAYWGYPWFNYSIGYPRFQPWYDDRADYNTNARDYYNYLGDENYDENLQRELINRLLRRDLDVNGHPCIKFTKTGDWIDNGTCSRQGVLPTNYDDLITLHCEVVLSRYQRQLKLESANKNVNVPNGSACREDGLWSPDYQSVISELDQQVVTLKKQIDQIYDSIAGIDGTIEVPRRLKPVNNLVTPLDLGHVTDDTRVTISWHHGSTRRTDEYTVKQLRSNDCHIMAENMLDRGDALYMMEIWTKIKEGTNQLWVTAVHEASMNSNGTWSWVHVPWGNDPQHPYYDEQDPRLVSGEYEGIAIDEVIVYDRVAIIQPKD